MNTSDHAGRLRIVKVGGSLLRLSDCGARLRCWREAQSPAQELWLAGGGEVVDVVRSWDHRFQLGNPAAYSLTLAALRLTAPLLRMVAGLAEEQVLWVDEELARFPPQWHDRYRLSSWEATSDTLAALIARARNADELVLLKASPIPTAVHTDLTALARLALVDPVFPEAALGISSVRIESPPAPPSPEELRKETCDGDKR